MDMPKTKHGCSHNKGAHFNLLTSSYLLFSSFRGSLFLTNALNVRACGCLITLRYFLTSLLGRILPLYLVEGSKGASHGGEPLSAPRKFYDTIDLLSNEPENARIYLGLILLRNRITNG
jgi:hypothetical protein